MPSIKETRATTDFETNPLKSVLDAALAAAAHASGERQYQMIVIISDYSTNNNSVVGVTAMPKEVIIDMLTGAAVQILSREDVNKLLDRAIMDQMLINSGNDTKEQ